MRAASGWFVLFVPLSVLGCDVRVTTQHRNQRPQASRLELSREPIQALAAIDELDPRIAAIGNQLFFDKRLSGDDTMSCSSCHDLKKGGDDGLRYSKGVSGEELGVNSPTVFNAALNFAQFWDGRAATLEEQAGGPVENPNEMASTWPEVLRKLKQDPVLVARFEESFVDGLNEASVRVSLATFERQLVATGSAFDRWLAGDESAISEEAKAGYEDFKSLGCVACHQGSNVGGNMYQKVGVLGDYFGDRGNITQADAGRFNVTGRESDRFVFRVPSLRYVVHTAPYFHDGTQETLEQAVQTMATYQLGRALGTEQVSRLVAFLTSLAGPAPKAARSGRPH